MRSEHIGMLHLGNRDGSSPLNGKFGRGGSLACEKGPGGSDLEATVWRDVSGGVYHSFSLG